MKNQQVVAKGPERVVVKIGSSVLSAAGGSFNLERVKALVTDFMPFYVAGKELLIVSSGAIACGMRVLAMAKRPASLPELQACAAIGQGKLMKAYEDAVASHNAHTAQVLLTRDALHDRLRYLNIRNTLKALLGMRVIPIINENDTVSTEEIRFGDNDMLAALVATLVQPDVLIILTDVDGLLDPGTRERVKVLESVRAVEAAIESHVFDDVKAYTVGGMQSKLSAVRVAMQAGVPVVLANGMKTGTLEAVLKGEDVGTRFLPGATRTTAKKLWLAHNAQVKGQLTLDAGAHEAVAHGGKSLLAGGIKKVTGKFKAGDLVSLQSAKGVEFARGLTNYEAGELAQIIGKKTSEIRAILKGAYFEEVVHRDNLAVFHREKE